jgi:hypothetical protein
MDHSLCQAVGRLPADQSDDMFGSLPITKKGAAARTQAHGLKSPSAAGIQVVLNAEPRHAGRDG